MVKINHSQFFLRIKNNFGENSITIIISRIQSNNICFFIIIFCVEKENCLRLTKCQENQKGLLRFAILHC